MKKSQLMASSFGNILEWFDTGLFIYLAPILGQTFFPTENAVNATIVAFGVFAAGFICRPLGSIFFGYVGDRVGRVKALIFSMLLITSSTLLAGLLPSYGTIGIWAPVCFVCLRLLQGLSVGGEYGGMMVYLAESAPNKKRGFFTSFAAVGANLGFLLATVTAIVLNTVVPSAVVASWGWRIPFILCGLLGFFILYFRLNLLETAAFLSMKTRQRLPKAPLLTAFRKVPGKLLQIFGLTCMGTTFYYVFFGYMPNYLSQYFGISLVFSLSCQAVLLLMMLILIPMAGRLGDRFGRKKLLSTTACSIIVLALPCFYLIETHVPFLIFVGLALATVITSLEQGNTLVTAVENCPLDCRASGVRATS